MKLTEEQSKMVEDNHNLIYWYAHMKHLDVNEWYDILAIELCYAVMKYDPSKSVLSTYFKLRADGVLYKQYQKSKLLKNSGLVVEYIDNQHGQADVDIVPFEDSIIVKDIMDGKHGEILRLKATGYTQNEISQMLNISQAQVSRIIKKFRKEYGYDR